MVLTRSDHIDRTRRLKTADKLILACKGPNVAQLGDSVQWSKTPRSGARWTDSENGDLLTLFHSALNRALLTLKQEKLGAGDLALIAWRFGRTANAINEQLYKLLGPKSYHDNIDI